MNDDEKPMVAESLDDLEWFQRVVERSERRLRHVPAARLSPWYRINYGPEYAPTSLNSGKDEA